MHTEIERDQIDLESIWQVPVVKGDKRLNVCCEELVKQTIIEMKPELIHLPSSKRQDATPGDATAIVGEAEARYEVDIFLPLVIMIIGDIPRIPIPSLARSV